MEEPIKLQTRYQSVCSMVSRSSMSQYYNTIIMRFISRAREGKLCRKHKKKSLTDVNDLNTAVLEIVVINP